MRLHQHAYKLWLLALVRKKGSLAAAALEARLSSSAVSQALSQLEEILSIPLLCRSKKGVQLTPESERLLEFLEPALKTLEAFDPTLLTHTQAPRRMRIGAYESIAVDLLPRFIPLLRARWPHMNLEIEIARSRLLLEKCRNGDLDLVFVADATHGPSLHVRPYATDSFGLFVARKADVGVTPTEVVNCIGFGALKVDDKHHTRNFRRFLKSLSPHLRPTLETESFEVILALVKGGAIAGVLPLRVARRGQGELRRLDVPSSHESTDPGSHDLSLACHSSFSKSLFDTILEIARAESIVAHGT